MSIFARGPGRRIVLGAALAGILAGACGQSSPTPSPTPIVPAAAETVEPVLGGPCPIDRVGNRTVAHDPVLICTDSPAGPRWVLSASPLTTTTTTCRPAVPPGKLEADQAQVDSLIGGRRTAESAVAQIQLTVDNDARQIAINQRYVDDQQAATNLALAAYTSLPTDTNHNKLLAAQHYLADAKDILAQWQAARTTALANLTRGKATLGDWDKQIGQAQQTVAADKAVQGTLTCS